MRLPPLLEKLLTWALFLFGLYYYCFRVLGFNLDYTPGDFGDSRFINYVLEHGYRWLAGVEPEFWTANFMYPLKDNIAISDSMAGVFPLYALFRFIGFESETAYQLWWVSCSALNFFCAHWAFRKLGISVLSAALGAYLFAFGINNLNQFVHLQINCKFFIPITIAHVYLFLSTVRIRYFVLSCLALVLQFYSNAYLAIFLLLFCVLFVLLFLFTGGRFQAFKVQITGKTVLLAGLSVACSALMIAALAIPYYKMGKALGGSLSYSSIAHGLPWFYSYFLPHEMVANYDFLKNSPIKLDNYWYLHDYFPGLFVYAGLLAGCVHLFQWLIGSRKNMPLPLLVVVVCVVFIFVFSRTHHQQSLFAYIQSWPGFSSMRLPGRFMVVLVFAFIWLGTWYLDALQTKNLRWLPVVLIPFMLFDNMFNIEEGFLRSSTAQRRYRTEAFAELIRQRNTSHKKIVAVVNTRNDDELFQIDVMLATQKMNLYTFNGYSSNCYGDLCFAFHDPQHKQLKIWMQKNHITEDEVAFIHL